MFVAAQAARIAWAAGAGRVAWARWIPRTRRFPRVRRCPRADRLCWADRSSWVDRSSRTGRFLRAMRGDRTGWGGGLRGADVPTCGRGLVISDGIVVSAGGGHRDGLRRLLVLHAGGRSEWSGEDHWVWFDSRGTRPRRPAIGRRGAVLAERGQRAAPARRQGLVIDGCRDGQDAAGGQDTAGGDNSPGHPGGSRRRQNGLAPVTHPGNDGAPQAGVSADPCDQSVGGRSGTGLTTMVRIRTVHFGLQCVSPTSLTWIRCSDFEPAAPCCRPGELWVPPGVVPRRVGRFSDVATGYACF